jgi:hypothetical protein
LNTSAPFFGILHNSAFKFVAAQVVLGKAGVLELLNGKLFKDVGTQ